MPSMPIHRKERFEVKKQFFFFFKKMLYLHKLSKSYKRTTYQICTQQTLFYIINCNIRVNLPIFM